jgi:cell division protein FtsQ
MKTNLPGRNKRVSSTRQRKQQHLLEVTIRRDIARKQHTRKLISVTFKIILLGGLFVGVWIGGKEAARRLFWENPDYYLTDLRVPVDGALTREQILGAAGIVEGRNIFTIDLAKARHALEKLPQVDVAEMQRVLPNRIDISIVERKPIAWVTAKADEDPSLSDRAFLIDARAVIMRAKTASPDYILLPVISGVEVDNLVPGQTVRSFEMQAALDLLRLNTDSTRFQIRNIDLSKGYCLVATDRTHAHITFGLVRIDLQLARLNRLLDRIQPTQREIQTVNLLVERNVPVTFADTPTPEVEPVPQTAPAHDKFLPSRAAPAILKATPAPAKEKPPVPAKTSDDSTTTKFKETPKSSGRKPGATAIKKPFRP